MEAWCVVSSENMKKKQNLQKLFWVWFLICESLKKNDTTMYPLNTENNNLNVTTYTGMEQK